MRADQIAKWKAAVADLHKRQRGRRGKRRTGIDRADADPLSGISDDFIGQTGIGGGRVRGAGAS